MGAPEQAGMCLGVQLPGQGGSGSLALCGPLKVCQARMIRRWQRDSCRSLGGWGYIGGDPEMPLSRKGGWKHSDPPMQGGQSRGDLGCCRRSRGVWWGSAEQLVQLVAGPAFTVGEMGCVFPTHPWVSAVSWPGLTSSWLPAESVAGHLGSA